MPVSVQISLVPLPLKSMCVVSVVRHQWVGVELCGCTGTGLQAGQGGRPGLQRGLAGPSSLPPMLCVSGQGERGVVSRVYFCACFLNKKKK